ncbi:hypothetical protein IAF45_06835 [Acinetobacter baumannii]|nr:hypothetical protein [Acinetobacter baumannii]
MTSKVCINENTSTVYRELHNLYTIRFSTRVSPLGGPWTVAGAAFTAYSACVAGNDYCEDGGNY